jgi:hypothetical protein
MVNRSELTSEWTNRWGQANTPHLNVTNCMTQAPEAVSGAVAL